MSNYTKATIEPTSGNWEDAQWLDDYYGPHIYGVYFPSTGIIHKETEREWQTRDETVGSGMEVKERQYDPMLHSEITALRERRSRHEIDESDYIDGIINLLHAREDRVEQRVRDEERQARLAGGYHTYKEVGEALDIVRASIRQQIGELAGIPVLIGNMADGNGTRMINEREVLEIIEGAVV